MKRKDVKLVQDQKTWIMHYNGQHGPGNYPTIQLGKNQGPYFITFTIDPSTAARFSEDDPIWVADNAKPKGLMNNHSQIAAWKVKDSGTKLVVFDWNDEPGNIHYQLNFNDNTTLDPVIENGGGPGGQPIFGDVSSGVLLLAALVAFTLGMWVYKRVHGRLPANASEPGQHVG